MVEETAQHLNRDSKEDRSADSDVSTLSQRLSLERIARQIICRLHATLDKDFVLQSAVDAIGRLLSADRCFIVRLDNESRAHVTHEYAESGFWPLGLGRVSEFPSSMVEYFRRQTTIIGDQPGQIAKENLTALAAQYFSESGIQSLLGVPVRNKFSHDLLFLIAETNRQRQWPQRELEYLDEIAQEIGSALAHAEEYGHIKDQILKLDVINTLTQQLTQSVESNKGQARYPIEETKSYDQLPTLSHRELEVLKLIAIGLANREIAQKLFLTESTVELHASRIRKKLKLKSRTALVKYACDNHLV